MGRFLRLVLGALGVVGVNDLAIGVGFFAWGAIGGNSQAAVQAPLAFLVSGVGVVLWLLKGERWHRLEPERDLPWVFLLAFPLGALHFVPIHYLVTGYLTSAGNLVAGALFAFCANAPAFALAASMRRREQPGAA